MRVATVLRLAALSVVLSSPLASAPVAFAGDNSNLNDAMRLGVASPYDPGQDRDPSDAITHPSTVPADE